MKILCLCSCIDLRLGYGCTPAWWQLFKALHHEGHDVIVSPYQGAAVESPWWRTYPNPCELEGRAFAAAKSLLGDGAVSLNEGVGGKLAKNLIESWVRPRWVSSVGDILQLEKNVDVVIILGIPVNHVVGIPDQMRSRFKVPIVYYDGDVPASLPRFGGFASGFRIYENASLAEYDAVICNSTGGMDDLKGLGARRVESVYWGADPDLFHPVATQQNRDVYFYGLGVEYREKWINAMLVEPSRRLSSHVFVAGGSGFPFEFGDVKKIGAIPPSRLAVECCSSRINLNITRETHASVKASSSTRLFELAAMSCCIVTNPIEGLDTWFEIGKDLLVVNSGDESVELYGQLLADPAQRRLLGESARNRVLESHTYRHRAAQLTEFIKSLVGCID